MRSTIQNLKLGVRAWVQGRLYFLIIMFLFAVTVKTPLSYGEEKGKSGQETIIGKTVGKVALIDHNFKMIAVEDPRGEKLRFPIDDSTTIWMQVNFESIKAGDDLIIDYRVSSDGFMLPVSIYINQEKDKKEKTGTAGAKGIDINEDDGDTDDFKNNEFFEGIDTTKMDSDMDLGVSDDEKK